MFATKDSCGGQASVEAECYELPLADGVPVREMSLVAEHSIIGVVEGGEFSVGAGGRLERRPARKNARPTRHNENRRRSSGALARSRYGPIRGRPQDSRSSWSRRSLSIKASTTNSAISGRCRYSGPVAPLSSNRSIVTNASERLELPANFRADGM